MNKRKRKKHKSRYGFFEIHFFHYHTMVPIFSPDLGPDLGSSQTWKDVKNTLKQQRHVIRLSMLVKMQRLNLKNLLYKGCVRQMAMIWSGAVIE